MVEGGALEGGFGDGELGGWFPYLGGLAAIVAGFMGWWCCLQRFLFFVFCFFFLAI